MPRLKTILVNLPLHADLLARIARQAPDAKVYDSHALAQRPELWGEVDVLFTHHIDPARLREATQLRWIQTMGAGVEWLLVPEVIARSELTITNASGVHADPIAEHVFTLMLALTRRIPQVLAQQRERRWDSSPFQLKLPTLAGATLGILGVGAIGQRIAAIGAAFNMRVIGTRRGGQPAPHVERMYPPEQLHALLEQAHYVVNALPLTQATRDIIGPAELAAMRGDAVLINIGRGETIQTDALVDALRHKRIAGAGLDVTAPEPLPPEHPLWELANVIITPHFSGGRLGYVELVTDIFVDNLRRYQAGETLHNVVDAHAGY